MDAIKEIMNPFLKKLSVYAMGRALLAGLSAGLFTLAMCLAAIRFTGLDAQAAWMIVVFSIAFLAGAAGAYWLKYRPTLRDAARWTDRQFDLEERVTTMVDYADQDSPLLKLQRQDTQQRLRACSLRDLRFPSIPKHVFLMLAVLALLCVVLALLPNRAAADNGDTGGALDSGEAARVQNMLNELRALIEASNIGLEDKVRLLDELSQIEAGIPTVVSSLEDIASIIARSENLNREFREAEQSANWVYHLLETEAMKELGNAILSYSLDRVNDVLGRMRGALLAMNLEERIDRLTQWHEGIEKALAYPPGEGEESMVDAFSAFAKNLNEARELLLRGQNADAMIAAAFDSLQNRMKLLLTEEQVRHDDNLERPDEGQWGFNVSGLVTGDLPEPESEETDANAGENGKTYQMFIQSAIDPSGKTESGTGRISEQHYILTETIYDPEMDDDLPNETYVPGIQRLAPPESSSGQIPYGQVYGSYYYRLLEQLSSGEITEEMSQTITNYYYGM